MLPSLPLLVLLCCILQRVVSPSDATSAGSYQYSHYCVRTDHQSTIKNNVLYINGGVQTFAAENNDGVPEGEITYGFDIDLTALSTSTSWDWKSNFNESFIPIDANPRTDTLPPFVSRGALFSGAAADPKIYLYGGTTSYINTSNSSGFEPPSSNQYSLWSYDTTSEPGTWDQYDITDTSPQRPNSGASAEAPDQGLAFYLNGQIDNGSSPTTQSMGSAVQFLEGMVVINTTSQTAKNLSTSSFSGTDPRTRGKLQYIPAVSTRGIMVYLGGSSKSAINHNSDDIGDLAASGDVPDPRVDHCLVGAWAPDNSSFNIYLYGGRGYGTDFYDQIYVLSLPSFRWIKVYEGSSPRFGMTCHVVGNRQMLTVGGFSTTDLSAACDWEVRGVAIYDMASLIWGSVYNASAPPYQVPDPVWRVIGGGPNGSANLTTPSANWTNSALARLFGQTLTSNSTTGASDPNNTATSIPNITPHHALRKGAIAGIVIGGVVALAIVFGAVILLRHKNKDRATVTEQVKVQTSPEPPMLDAYDNQKPAEMMGSATAEGRGPPYEARTWHVELGPPAAVAEAP